MPRRTHWRWLWLNLGLAVVFGTALGGLWAYRSAVERQIQAELHDARDALHAGRPYTARKQLGALAERWPNRAEVLFELGRCEQALGRFDEAVAAWSRVPSGSPLFARAAALLATEWVNIGRYTPAEDILLRALPEATGSDRYEVLRVLSRLYRFQGRNDEVRRLLRVSWGQSPAPAGLLIELVRLDTTPFPVEAWQRALESADPDDDRVWLGRASVAILTGRYDEAARWLANCRQRRPDDPPVWRAQLDLAQATDDVAAAWEALEHLPADWMSDAQRLRLRAWLVARQGGPDAERQALRDLVKHEPGDTEAWERLAERAIRAGDVAEAERLKRRKAEIDRAWDRYRKILLDLDENRVDQAHELALLAATLGRPVEARGWSLLDAQGPEIQGPVGIDLVQQSPIMTSSPEAGPSLASLLDDLRPDGESPPSSPTSVARVASEEPSDTPTPPVFTDEAESSGLRFVFDNGHTPFHYLPETMSGGVGLLDYDGDGWLDVYVVQGGPIPADPGQIGNRPSDRLFRNNGDGTFSDVTETSGIASFSRDYGLGVAVGDFDNDGWPDLFISRLSSYALYRNNGDGTFSDVTEQAGLGGHRHCPSSAAFVDLDNDGWLDLYVCHYMVWDTDDHRLCLNEKGGYFYCDPSKVDAAPDQVFRNNGDGTFEEITERAGFFQTDGRGLGVVAADFDDDGRIDLYVANDGTANYLFRNLGNLRFEEAGHESGVAANAEGGYQAGMGVASGDLDGDGRPEIIVTNFYGESATLYHNLGGGLFTDQTAPSGLGRASRYLLGFGVAMLDYDNDGRLDVVITNGHVNDNRPFYPYAMPALLLAGTGDGRLIDVSRDAGPPWSEPLVGRGLAVGDIDNDGHVDVILIPQNQPLVYLRNQTETGSFVTLKLEGTASNRDAVGAKITLTAGGRRQIAQRTGGGSYQSANDPRLHFGLGDANHIDSIEVRWPSGHIDSFEDLPTNTGYLLREANAEPEPLAGFSP